MAKPLADTGAPLTIRRLSEGDEERVWEANHLFDHRSQLPAARRFLASSDHYLLIAYLGDHPAGFVTAHRLPRLDTTRPMLFVYEVGVDEAFRGRGIGTALMRELARIAETDGFLEMFVLTNHSNTPAMRMYASAGGALSEEPDIAMYEWSWLPD